MPCYDGRGDEPRQPRTYNGLTGDQLEAVLCGLMTVIEEASKIGNTPLSPGAIGDVMARMDWSEIGVTRKQATDWWKLHKAADKARLERETRIREEAERQAMLKASALKKLTPAERSVLGLS